MERTFSTIEFECPIIHIVPLRKSADELGIDILVDSEIINKGDYSWKKITILGDNTTVFSLAFNAGLICMETKFVSPFKEMIEGFQNSMNKFKQNNQDATDKLG